MWTAFLRHVQYARIAVQHAVDLDELREMHRLQALSKLQWSRIDPDYITINSHFPKHFAHNTVELGVARALWSFPFEALIYVLKCISKCSNRKQVPLSVTRGFWLRRLLTLLFQQPSVAPFYDLPPSKCFKAPSADDLKELGSILTGSLPLLLNLHTSVIFKYTEFCPNLFAELQDGTVVQIQEIYSVASEVFLRVTLTSFLQGSHPPTELRLFECLPRSRLIPLSAIAFKICVWPVSQGLFLYVWSDK